VWRYLAHSFTERRLSYRSPTAGVSETMTVSPSRTSLLSAWLSILAKPVRHDQWWMLRVSFHVGVYICTVGRQAKIRTSDHERV
jgi:hypothetical protein